MTEKEIKIDVDKLIELEKSVNNFMSHFNEKWDQYGIDAQIYLHPNRMNLNNFPKQVLLIGNRCNSKEGRLFCDYFEILRQ